MNTLSGIVDSAAAVMSAGSSRIDRAKAAAKTGAGIAIFARDLNKIGGAITQVSGQTSIISRVFIEESLTEEMVLPNLMKTIHEWYAAQIVAALHLSKMVTASQSVQDVLSLVNDGRMVSTTLTDRILNKVAGQESFLSNYLGEVGLEALKYDSLNQPIPQRPVNNNPTYSAPNYQNTQKFDSLNQPIKSPEINRDLNSYSVKSVNASDNRIGPMGELFEVTLSNPNDPSIATKIPLFIQMQPSLVPHAIAPRFIDLNVQPSLWQKWTQMRTGEKSFWQAFVTMKDMMDRKKALLKNPQYARAMADYLSTISKKDVYAAGDIKDSFKKSANARSANLANSVVIFSEETILQAKADSNIDLHRADDRARYFRDTYTMIVCVVDTIHQRVTIYFNGIDGELDVSYNEFRPKDQKFDPNMFMQALSAFSTNSIGRLR
jgi:hypothetical protein